MESISRDFNNIPDGWWMHITPLAKLEPEEWILGVLKRGKKSWITEMCKSFNTREEAYDWGLNFIKSKIS